MEVNLSSWNTHDWTSRLLEIVPGQHLIYQECRECGRGFVDEFSTGKRYSVSPSVFRFYRLSDEVTSRWLSEKCPIKGQGLIADEADRQARFPDGSFRSAPGEVANDG
jgi:hypothetical protein